MKELAAAFAVVALAAFLSPPARARELSDQSAQSAGGQIDLAQELTNPLADLLTIPSQMDYESGIGLADDVWKLQIHAPDESVIHRNWVPPGYIVWTEPVGTGRRGR